MKKINGKVLKWKGASEFYCFHYDPKTGEMKVYELEKVPDEEIENCLIVKLTEKFIKDQF